MLFFSYTQDIFNKNDKQIAQSRWMQHTGTPEQLIDIIVKSGWSFVPGYIRESNSKKPKLTDVYFTDLIAIDVDNDNQEHYLSFDAATQDPFLQSHALFAYTTPSHTGERNRFRVVFKLKERIYEAEKYSELAAILIDKYHADRACKDWCRLFFGNTNAKLHTFDLSNEISEADIFTLKTNKKPVEVKSVSPTSPFNTKTDTTFSNTVNKVTIEQAREILSFIDGDALTYEDWLKVCLGLISEFGNQTAIELIDDWSPDLKIGTAAKFKNEKARSATFASVVYHAQQNGYCGNTFGNDTKSCSTSLSNKTDVTMLGTKFEYSDIMALDMTVRGVAEYILSQYDGNLLFNITSERWVRWTGKIWETIDGKLGEYDYINKLIDRIDEFLQSEQSEILENQDRSMLSKFNIRMKNSLSDSIAKSMRSMQRYWCKNEDFDSVPNVVNLKNGILNLETSELVPHSREYRQTVIIDTNYNPEAKYYRFVDFINTITDAAQNEYQLAAYLQRCIGISVLGLQKEEAFFFCYGTGANGKTVFFNIIREVLGDYYYSLPEVVLSTRQNSERGLHMARLHGKRFAVSTELGENLRLDEAFIKRFVGGDSIDARNLYEKPFSFTPQTSLWMMGNYKPRISGTDIGFWRRCQFIPFSVTIPEEKRVPQDTLISQLLEEKEGILLWIIEGLQVYLQQNKSNRVGLQPPDFVQAIINEYRDDQNIVKQYVDECCAIDPAFSCMRSTLYNDFKVYCHTEGIEKPIGPAKFYNDIGMLKGISQKKQNGSRIFEGLMIKESRKAEGAGI